MGGKHTTNGKAFEYACVTAFKNKLNQEEKAISVIDNTKQYQTALKAYEKLTSEEKERYNLAAETAVKLIFPLEPMLTEGSGVVIATLGTDAAGKGKDGDVRDVIFMRTDVGWEMGLSCKHNHEGLKHPRITESKDFGMTWMGYPCSHEFMKKMDQILFPLYEYEENKVRWREIPDKWDRFYVPILEAFIEEFQVILNAHEDAPAKLVRYFFGSSDFYKVISQEKSCETKIQGFNMSGTMNMPANGVKPRCKITKLQFPTKLYNAGFKKGSKTTITLVFDGGWTIDLRIHNKDEFVKLTGLSFEVTLGGVPTDVYQQQRSWLD